MEAEKKKDGRGGARTGAGRKKDPSLKIQIRVKPCEIKLIKKAAEKSGVTIAAMEMLKDC